MDQSLLSEDNNGVSGREGSTISPADPSPQAQQRRPTALLLVGDPGLGANNVGRNFDRAAATQQTLLERRGYNVISKRVSNVNDVRSALTSSGNLDRVEYYGHSASTALFVGERSGAGTNLDSFNLNTLSNAKLNRGAVIALNSCNAGRGDGSIASRISQQLNRTVEAYNGPIRFSTTPNGRDGRSRPPERGDIYLVPETDSISQQTFDPSRVAAPAPRSRR
jgi:hypothetical protein